MTTLLEVTEKIVEVADREDLQRRFPTLSPEQIEGSLQFLVQIVKNIEELDEESLIEATK